MPALIRVKHQAILPNRVRADVRECFLLVSGFGDLASERAQLRGGTAEKVSEPPEGQAGGPANGCGPRALEPPPALFPQTWFRPNTSVKGDSTVRGTVMTIEIARATPGDAADSAVLVGELLDEIMHATGVQAFRFDLAQTSARVRAFLEQESYSVFLARADGVSAPVGVISLCESRALYAEGSFGIIPELYVRPEYRGGGVGARLLEAVTQVALDRGWTRLEVTTPPLPQFQRTLRFYENAGFGVTGGRKLKLGLHQGHATTDHR